MFISVSSNMNPLELRQLVEDQVKYRMERVAGVAAVNVYGGLKREIHIDLHAAQIKALGLSPDHIIAALQNENQNIPAGLYDKGNLEVLIRTQGEYRSLDEIRNTVITLRQGSPIQIKDVADVVDSWEEVRDLNRVNGKPGLRMSINKQSGANTVEVAEATRQEIEAINRDFPQIQLIPQFDSSVYIKQSISNVGSSTIFGGILAVIILFLFLRNLSSTAIIATAIPISIIATFGLMYFGGFTLNIITFGGLALGIGMLVDNAIVVLENTFRHRESGLTPIDSAVVGASEVGSAIVSSTLTTIVVFFPVVFIRGMSGIMFQQMAYVVTFSLLCSLLVALTLVPMLSSRFLHYRPARHEKDENTLQKIYATSEAVFAKVENRYAQLLQKALRKRKQVVLLTALLFIGSIILIRFIGVELMPKTDESEVRLDIETAVGSQLEVVDQATLAIEEVVRQQVPELVMMSSRIGGGGYSGGGGHTSEVRLTLVPIGERKRSSE